ncbi:LacI family DNA-binding transcriptional regulator [Kribbella sp. NPDC004138]
MAGEGGAPLYERIKAELRAAIGRGEYEPGSPFVTQRELCERYGVSTTTAVKALNDLVAEGLLIRRQGRGTFVAEPAARQIRSTSGNSIACIVHGLNAAHVSNVVSGVESVCAELGYRMYLSDTARQDVAASPQREAQALREALDSGVAGIVLYPVEGHHNTDLLTEVKRHEIPMVLVDRYRPELPTDAVIVDNFSIGYQLTQHLVAAGHERILTLWSETDVTSVRDRLTGHVQALRDSGLTVRPEFTSLRPYQQLPQEQRLAMLKPVLEGDEPPTAVLCANGYVVAAAAKDLVALGKDVPTDIALAGMDDAGPFDLLPLTTVSAHLPSHELGVESMRLLSGRIDGTSASLPPRQITLSTSIHTHDSGSGYLRAVGSESA